MSNLEKAKNVFIPLVITYFDAKENIFLNRRHQDDNFMQSIGNFFLTPCQYLLNGKQYIHIQGKDPELRNLFSHRDHPAMEMIKLVISVLLLPISLILGSIFKGIGYCFSGAIERYNQIEDFYKNKAFISEPYLIPTAVEISREHERHLRQTKPLSAQDKLDLSFISDKVSQQQLEEINALSETKKKDLIALKDLGALLDKHKITWWVDAGTLLGSYRHEGYIPWDEDIDISILQEDHDRVRHAVENDEEFKSKYRLLDWSTSDQPKTLLKLYVIETQSTIDLYHYRMGRDEEGNEIVSYISPHYNRWYMGGALNAHEEVCERPFKKSDLLPITRMKFDGVSVGAPRNAKAWLEHHYGNIDPAKKWNPETQEYEKVPGHPYWDN